MALSSLSSSWSALSVILIAAPLLYICYVLGCAVYNVYLHPLRHFPGPKAWIAFPVIYCVAAMRGLLDDHIREFHDKYGEVVRISQKQVSFITAQAWKDIHGHGHKSLPKVFIRKPGDPADILVCSEEEHTRFRKALAPAFSEKALRDQEPLIEVYIDLLIEKLKALAASGQPADMVKWYNLTTFDLIGDLAFGESFDGLQSQTLHHWVAMLFSVIKIVPFLRIAQEHPFIMKMLMLLMPNSIIRARKENFAYTKRVVTKRVHDKALHGRPDFMDSMLEHRGGKNGLTDEELVSNSNVLIIAGSETTATLLSGVTYWLLRTPDALQKVTEEVRGAFESEEDINFTKATARLPYMLACLDEAFRLYPPVPSGLPRMTLAGPPTNVSGYQVPAGTQVSIHQSAAYRSTRNFHLPHSYVPERFLPSATHDAASPFYNDNRAVLQPFSVGPRNCIGRNLAYNEMRLILARVLWNFDLELCEESRDWHKQRIFVLWEKPPLWCRLSLRGWLSCQHKIPISSSSTGPIQQNKGQDIIRRR